MKYKIEHDVPVAPRAVRPPSELRELLLAMVAGDSVVLPKRKAVGLYNLGKKEGVRFVVRAVDAENARAWMIGVTEQADAAEVVVEELPAAAGGER